MIPSAAPDGPAAAWPSARRAWWTIAVFFVVAVLSYSDRLVLSLLVDPVRADLHLSDTQVSLVQGLAFAMIYSVAGLPFGRIADVFPRRVVIIAGVVIWSLSTAACGYADSFAALFMARIGVGVGEAAFAPAAVSMIADSFAPNRRGLAIGLLLTGMSVGSGMAIVIGGGLLEIANGGAFAGLPLLGALAPWRAVLVALGLAGTAPVLLLLTLREPLRQETEAERAHGTLRLADVLAGFRSRAVVLAPLYAAVAIVSAGDFSIQNWTPALLSRRFGFSPGEIAGTLGLVSILVGGAGTVLGGYLSDRQGARGGDPQRIRVAMLAATAGLLGAAIALASTGAQAIACFGIWIFMSAISGTIGITVLQNVVPNKMRGIGTAAVSFCNVIMGMAAGTALTAVLTDHVFRDPLSVGLSMTTVTGTAGLIALLLFGRAQAGLTGARLRRTGG
ncbi:MFS transporter [Phenylobacterium sp.]|uniref:MFS transporter n=1 Tax=Phenylobacterium sp. TaxID=1871053 RepID=UPI0035ADB4E8